MSSCPRCSGALETLEYAPQVHVEQCVECGGLLVHTRQMIGLLRLAAGVMLDHIDPTAVIRPFEGPTERIGCPSCGKRMDLDGYQGMNLVKIDRCSPCSKVWIDPGELAVMATLYARTQRQVDLADARAEAQRKEQMQRLSRMMLSSAQANRAAARGL